ncbi:MAG TPA: glycosyltransferase family 4 protein [Nitrospiraceae bacterium]|nr:glycosyltransferase family 4 protein [Nitrospiraceae bacterium]
MATNTVIHVITRLDRGGSARNTMLTALGHDRVRYEPLVVAGRPGRWDAQGGQAATDENCRLLDKAGIPWIIIPTLIRKISPLKDLLTFWALVRLFRQERPAIVHTHTSKAGVLGRLAAWWSGVPAIVHTPHGHVFYGHFNALWSWVFVLVERLLARVTTRLIALTEAERDDHLERGVGREDQFVVIPSGIDLERFQDGGQTRSERPDWFPCPPGSFVVGSVGWLTPVKGHRFLIEAAARLKPFFPNLHVVLVGNGELQTELSALADRLGLKDSVHFLGERDDVEVCLSAMDLFVLPSLNEGMGRALVEAMAAGLPVIASRTGGVPALIEHGRTGLLVPAGDADALAEAIRQALDRPDWAKRMGQAASQRIDRMFDAAAMVHAVEQVYEQALSEAGIR